MGIVEEVGSDVKNLKKGDRVVIPFNIGCGECFFCNNQMESQCDNSNPHGEPGGLFGFAEDFGNHPGGQAEYLRVPYADFTSFKVPKKVNWMMNRYYSYRTSSRLRIGAWSMGASKKGTR